MRLQGTPEEIDQAKVWWARQKKRVNDECKEVKKKDKNSKKDTSLVSTESKARDLSVARSKFFSY